MRRDFHRGNVEFRLLVVIGVSVTEFFSQPACVTLPVCHSQPTNIGTHRELAQEEAFTKKLGGKYADDGTLSGRRAATFAGNLFPAKPLHRGLAVLAADIAAETERSRLIRHRESLIHFYLNPNWAWRLL